MDSPYRRATDSPSRQLLLELGRLSIAREQEHREELDRHDEQLHAVHRQSLAAADEQRRRLRETALNALQAHELQLQLDEQHRRLEQDRQLHKLRRERAEREKENERRKLEDARAADSAEKEAEEQRRRREEEEIRAEQERARRAADEEQTKKDAERKAQEERIAKEAQAKQAAIDAFNTQKTQQAPPPQQAAVSRPPKPQTAPPTTNGFASDSAPDRTSLPNQEKKEADHLRYLQIHKDLKELRKYMKDQVKSNPKLKEVMGEGRRSIQKCVGQLGLKASENKGPQSEVLKVLRSGLQFPGPQVNVTKYLFSPPNVADSNGPGLFVYFLSMLAKKCVHQWLGEAAMRPELADPVGILLSSMFAQVDFLWNGIPLIDILVAKFHKVCPVLFGIYGPENTQAGKVRLGWEQEGGAGGPFCSEQRHSERMTGLGAGYSAIALRNFDKSAKMSHPYPPYHWWQALANIVNLPPDQATKTHLVVLKAMIENSEKRILEAFGDAGRAALRVALRDFPIRTKLKDSQEARGLMLLADIWKRDRRFYL